MSEELKIPADLQKRYDDLNGCRAINVREKLIYIERVARAEAELATLREENARLRATLGNVVEGNDLALARGHSIENWRNSDFRRHATELLNAPPAGKEGNNAD